MITLLIALTVWFYIAGAAMTAVSCASPSIVDCSSDLPPAEWMPWLIVIFWPLCIVAFFIAQTSLGLRALDAIQRRLSK